MSEGLFRAARFTGFGPGALGDCAPLGGVRGRRGRLRDGVRGRAPRLPGVYGMIDGAGELVYVGKARVLRSRLLSYFRPGGRDEKAGRIARDARRVVWEVAADEFAALLRELELIRRWRPRHNVHGQPRRRGRAYLCVGRRPAPHAFLAAERPKGVLGCFGPLPGRGKGREAVRRLNDLFGLRDCPRAQDMVFAGQGELFPLPLAPGCIRHDLGTCLAPCAALCSPGEYAGRARAALDFLRGRDASAVEALAREMAGAAANLAFERAAALRDRLEPLTWLAAHLERLRRATALSFVYPLEGHDAVTRWYLVRGGQVRGVLPAPADAEARARAAAALEAVYSSAGPRAAGHPGLDEVDGVLLVDGWFRRHREERKRTRPPAEALRECRGPTG